MNIKKWVWLLLLPILMILGGKMGAETVQAQTLSNAITEVKLWDSANLREATLIDGVYQLNEGGKYSYFINFDLSHYGSNLQDGDVFTFTVPEGTTIGNGTTFPLTDKDTQVQLAVLSMTSNGAGKGGLVTVRLQNLADFYAKTVATGVKGSFFFDFETATVGANMSWPYETSELANPLTHLVTVKAKLPPGTINTAGENYAKIGGAILNRPYNSAVLGKQGNYIHSWTVRINTQQKSYSSPIIITDVIPDSSAPMQFIPETFILRSGSFTNSLSSISNAKILKLGTDYTVTFNATYTEFTLTIPNPGNSAFMLSYSTTSPEDGSIVANTVKMEVDGQLLPQNEIRPNTFEHYIERSSQITSGGIITADISRSLVLYKQDSVTGQLLPGAIFKVTAPSGEEFILNPTDAKGRTATKVFTKDEIVGEFTVTEIVAPLGYVIDPTPFKVTIDADGTVKTVKNTKNPNAKTSLQITKNWDDANNQDGKRPASITVDIFANGTQLTDKTLTMTGSATDVSWTGQVTELPVFDAAGQLITYTISEGQVSGYEAPVIDQDTRTITNKYTPELINFTVTKTWKDANDQDGKRPLSVNFTLYKEVNGQKTQVEQRSLTVAGSWTTQFTGLAKYEAGQEIIYSVEEEVPALYAAEVTKDTAGNFTITNSYTPQTMDYQVTKVWEDANNQDGKRPASITVQLYKSVAGGAESPVTGKTLTLTAADQLDANTWSASFTGLPRFEQGQEITYSVKEEKVNGYEAPVIDQDTRTITNKYTPELINFTVTKTWKDANDQDGKRPLSVNITLYKEVNGQKTQVEQRSLTVAGSWTTQFTGLAKYEAGQEIIYSVEEEVPTLYAAEVTKDTAGNFTIINSYTPQTMDYQVTKVWDDANNQDGKRPASITVHLQKSLDGQTPATVASATITEADNWATTFSNLPVYEAGKKINYTVVEDEVSEYTTTISGDAANGFTITNTHPTETTKVSVTKTWEDASNQDGKRPASITVHLQKSLDGQTPATVASATITEADNWTTTFSNLPVYEAGKKITYTVVEDEVSEYTTTISGDAASGFTITNFYLPAVTEISGTKTWNDADNQDGKRPDSITVNLLANGQVVDSRQVSEATGWAYDFGKLATYKNGQLISYTIAEEEVPGYSASQDGYNLTNTYTPEKATITVNKTWEDADNQDGKRPSQITIHLMKTVNATKSIVATKTITAADNWTATFAELPVYEAGQKIVYSVEEETVTDYRTEIKDFTIINSYTPQTMDYQVTKVWDDANNQDGLRPESITVQLYKSVAGGAETPATGKTLILTAANQLDANTWSASFTGLPQFEQGQEIVYSVKEDEATLAVLAEKGYQSAVTGTVVTNSRTPEQIKISGKKVWDDADNQDGIRPEAITVQIMNGTLLVDEIQVTAANDWTFQSKDLPKYANGQEIAYTVVEVSPASYQASQQQEADGSYTLTNSYEPSKTSLLGTAIWSDINNYDGIRPDSIVVRLLSNGRELKALTISAETGWQYAFTDLPKYANGQEIVYSISSDPVAGYDLRIDGTQITNTHIPQVVPTEPPAPTEPPVPTEPPAPTGDLSSSVTVTPTTGKQTILPRTGQADGLWLTLSGITSALVTGFVLKPKKVN